MDVNAQDIREALASLDPDNAAHWTKDGKPAVAVVQAVAGEHVTRAHIDALAPNFTRSFPELPPLGHKEVEQHKVDAVAASDDAPDEVAEPAFDTSDEHPAEPAEQQPTEQPVNDPPGEETVQQVIDRMRRENADLRGQVERATSHIHRLEQQLNADGGGSPLDRALRARKRPQHLVTQEIR